MNLEKAQKDNKIWNVGFYIRLSREDVENDNSNDSIKTHNKAESESITSQRVILTDYLTKVENSVFVEEYVDDGFTGTNFNRPAFTKLIDDIRTKKINCIIVKDLSRFGRNYSEVGNYLEVLFPMLNVRFISIIDNCDSFLRPDSVSNIIVPVKNIMNESYCRDISLKVRSAFDARKRQGLFIGAYASYGYDKDPKNHNKLIVDIEASEVVKRIFKEYINGNTMFKIATTLNLEGVLCPAKYKSKNGIKKYTNEYGNTLGWKDTSIRRILCNQIYIGTLAQKTREKINYKIKKYRNVDKEHQIIIENIVEPIIDKETFNKAQELLKRDTKISFGKTKLDLLSGFLHCGDCGHGMSKKNCHNGSKSEIISYYNCSVYKRCGKAICSPHSIRKQELENVVWEYIKSYIQIAVDFNKTINEIKNLKIDNVRTDNLEKILHSKMAEKTKKQLYIDGLYPDFKSDIITKEEYLRFKEEATKELSNIENSIDTIKTQIESIKNNTQDENNFITHFLKYKDIEKPDRQMILEFINDIRIYENKTIEIDMKYKDEFKIALDFINSNKNLNSSKTQKVKENGENK